MELIWENFIFIERLKYRTYFNLQANTYFGRTYEQQEVDVVEERAGSLFGYEGKWSTKKQVAPPTQWVSTYPDAEFVVITPENYLDFISPIAL